MIHAPPELAIANDYRSAGISVIPIRLDGSKSPAVPKWNPYRERMATTSELLRWYRQPMGIGIVCGVQSGGLEVIDFDDRADDCYAAWSGALTPEIRGTLCVVETGGLGYHVIYRCDEVSGNHKIAMTAAGETMIESRGEGGYIVAVGSPLEVHASGSPYVQVRGAPLPEIPVYTPEQRRAMWVAAAALDERPDPTADYVRRRARELRPASTEPIDPSTPWGDYCGRAHWDDILIPAGWTTSNGRHWTRPGKSAGTSAVVCTAEDGAEVLVVFSANAGPLAADGASHRTWSKFGAYAANNHGGDRSAAAKAVRRQGYGGKKW